MNAKMKMLSEQLSAEHSQVYVNNDFRIRAHVGFECGFEARDRIAQEREAKLVEALEMAVGGCDCNGEGRYDGHKRHCNQPVIQQALADYKAEGDE